MISYLQINYYSFRGVCVGPWRPGGVRVNNGDNLFDLGIHDSHLGPSGVGRGVSFKTSANGIIYSFLVLINCCRKYYIIIFTRVS